jgi:glycosyltransferase involved in cell wall biosynthesis
VRVLVAGTHFPPHQSGGYELHCAGAVAHLREHGHDVRVLVSSDRRPGARDDDPEVFRELRRFPVRPARTSPWAACAGERHNAAVFAHHLAAFRPDAVCWWRLGELSVSLLECAHLPSVAVVCDGWPVEAPERDPWARRSRRAGPAPVTAVSRWLFVSAWLREHLAARGFAPAGSGLAPAGLEAGFGMPGGPRPWRGRLLYAGRLSALKGVDVAVAALAHLPAGTRLRVVGDGDATLVRAAARRAGVAARVDVRPARPRAEMAAEYAAADAVLHPVRWEEPFGLVPLEAMACGTPVVSTGTGGSAGYLRDGRNTLLVPREDPAAVAAAVARLAGTPGVREAIAAGGYATAAQHPAERGHAAVRRALEAVTARPARTPTRPPAALAR